ncbi:MAG: ABC transporter substrate-binding protein [Methanobacteriaceae archaeon]|nr:ABC transporter substrate-binding protein [Methanobacteriaceae archaeon]MDP2836965.1 ABC transporter substrate-binding protein [Methanobacteriaceae archaeon]MDP3034914.1 ABC transporter substrate-binding protein [Methanobacteriaceae archaeon]MDP3485576.1 ABC transporter substrate-binding protein [Methanobacteriaceae archaeon]MDP3624874.1 ABC transporter substrate-binding protein [Methanobacteriaceae archaeon]
MTIYVCMDDTDNLHSRGTGRLARAVADELAKNYPLRGVTRHQLYFHPDIPYTSHNSCGVIHLESDDQDELTDIFEIAREEMLNDFIEGSDPGLAVAHHSQILPPLVAYGRDAKDTVLNQGKSRTLARNLGIRLEGLGGTEDGVIGAMAGLGLAFTNIDGRFLQIGKIRDLTGAQTVENLLDAGIDIVFNIDGRIVTNGEVINEENKPVKPCPVNGKAVLFVEEGRDGLLTAVKRN